MLADCDCDFLVKVNRSEWEEHYDNCRIRLFQRDNAEVYRKNYPKNSDGSLALRNSNLTALKCDVLYHLALNTNQNLPATFGDVKFVCMGGTAERMESFARHIAEVLDVEAPTENITAASHRYAMYKVGPVLSVSHGIGIPSMTVVLQEVMKLLQYARARDPVVVRLGTSGGVGLPPGSVVVSTFGMSGTLTRSWDLPVLGKMVSKPALFDRRLAQEIVSMARPEDGFAIQAAGTMAADDFYRGQARLDGPFCEHTEQDKMAFLRTLRDRGVRNIEMEATALAALTYEGGLRAADVCVTLVDRLLGDQVLLPRRSLLRAHGARQDGVPAHAPRPRREELRDGGDRSGSAHLRLLCCAVLNTRVTESKETMLQWQKRPMIVVGRFIKKALQKPQANGVN